METKPILCMTCDKSEDCKLKECYRGEGHCKQYSSQYNKETNTKEDKVNHPKHYTWLKEKCGIEVIDITRHLDFNTGNAVGYLLRAGHKQEEGYTIIQKTIEDLKKAIFHINDQIKLLENGVPKD